MEGLQHAPSHVVVVVHAEGLVTGGGETMERRTDRLGTVLMSVTRIGDIDSETHSAQRMTSRAGKFLYHARDMSASTTYRYLTSTY